jgi:hypothetical protein
MGAREKKRNQRCLGKTPSRIKLGIVEVERQIIRDRIQNQLGGNRTTFYKETDQSVLDKFIVKRPHSSSMTRLMKSNKRLRKPD